MSDPQESTDASVTIGVVAHWVFCPRRAWLEVHGEKTDTAQMAVGQADHAAVDDATTSRSERLRAIDVVSERLRVHGRCDSVEVDADGTLTLVEHKAAPLRRSSTVTEPQRVQLALQALCLEEAGHHVAGAAVWFTTTKRRVDVELDAELRQQALTAVEHAHTTTARLLPPPPLEEDDRCQRCSHVSVCLPDEHRGASSVRRIGVGDPTGQALHLMAPGSRAKLKRGTIEVRLPGGESVSVPLAQTAGLVVHGNADVSSALIREMLWRGYPIVWCSWSGRVVGWATPARTPNGDARPLQHRLAYERRVSAARALVAAKIHNQRHLLRRHDLPERDSLREMSQRALTCQSIESVLGVEGAAASVYFRALSRAVKPDWLTVDGRTGRAAADPFNVALNLTYGLLLADVLRAVTTCGLDPVGGVLHTAGRNKPALALDLMEEFRPVVADSAVLWALNNAELRNEHFRDHLGVLRLTEGGRRAMIAAYERRVLSEFTHPEFGYQVTWRRAMEVQARMFLAFVTGERPSYVPIRVR